MQSEYERNQESQMGRGASRPYDEDPPSGRGRRQSGSEQMGGQWDRSQGSDDRDWGQREGGGRERNWSGRGSGGRESNWSGRSRGGSGRGSESLDRGRGGNDEYGSYGSEYIGRGPGSRNDDAGRFRSGSRFEERVHGSNTGLGSGYRDLGGSFETPQQRRWSQGDNRGFRGKGPKGYKRSDDAICEEVCQRLEDADVDPSEVSVTVKDGEVTLTGTIESRWDKRTMEDIAYSARGVKDVHNLVHVQSGESRESDEQSASDDQQKSNWRSSSSGLTGSSEQKQDQHQQPRAS